MRRSRLGLAALAAGYLLACEGRPQRTPVSHKVPSKGPSVSVIDLASGAPEMEANGLLGAPPGRRRSFDVLLASLTEATSDPETKAVVVRFGAMQLGMARSEELGIALAGVRAQMPVYCHAHGYTNATLMVAAQGCTKTWVSPAGEVEAIGLAAQVVYLHKLLTEELHLDVNFLQVGKFKGAEEPLTRDGPSDEARASLEGTLADLRKSWLQAIAEGTKKQGLAVEDGPYAPAAAKAAGLVDFVGYEDETADAARKDAGAVREVVRFGPGAPDPDDGVGQALRAIAGHGASAPVVLVRAVGQISMGGGGGLLGDGGGITFAGLSRQLARLEVADEVKVVVLRIDSPGGSALASDLLWHQLMRLRARKKLIVSIGDMAASGGYYLASTADFVFADATSIVGSIGVVGGKIAVGDALERVGVHAETFPADPKNPAAKARAAYASPLIAWDAPTKARVYESMTSVYDLFLARVAEGRKIGVDKVAASAEGRIFSGREGHARGLVDELGGLTAALAKARSLAGLPADAKLEVVVARSRLADLLGGGDTGAESRNPVSPASLAGAEVGAWLDRGVPGLASYVGSVRPLLEGEHAVCALPFALTVR